jgi:effector-binding domain-containing protein
MKWVSLDANVGKGAMEIADSLTNSKVVMNIEFGGARNAGTSLTLDDVGGRTKVTWSFAYSVGANPFERYAGLIMPSVIGNEYVRGLERLKKYVEAIPKVDISDLQVTRVSVAPQTLISVSEAATDTPEGMSNALRAAFTALSGAMQGAGLAADGQPISVAKAVNGDKVTIETSFPVKDLPQGLKLPEGVHGEKSGDGEALRVAFKGDHASLQMTYVKLLAYALTNGWKVRGSTWNEYVSDPTKADASQIETNVYLPVE